MLPSWAAFTDKEQWDSGTTYVYVVFFFSFPSDCAALSHLPPPLLTDAQLSSPPNYDTICSTATAIATPTQCNDSDGNTPHGTIIVIVTPYTVQQ